MSSVIIRRAPLAYLLIRPLSSVPVDFAALEAILRAEGGAPSRGRSGSKRFEVVVADDLPALQARHLTRTLQAAGFHARFSPTDELRYSQPVCNLLWLGVALFGCVTLGLLALTLAGISPTLTLAALMGTSAVNLGMMVHLYRSTRLGHVHRHAETSAVESSPVPA